MLKVYWNRFKDRFSNLVLSLKIKLPKAWDNFTDVFSGLFESFGGLFEKLIEGTAITGLILGALAFVIFCFTLGPLIFMWIWNAIIPGLTGWREINFWEAMGIVIIARILFGSRTSSSKDS